jgi:hypothetical protein
MHAFKETSAIQERHSFSLVGKTAVGALLVVLAGSHFFLLLQGPAAGALAPFRFPQKSVEYLKAHQTPGHLFNTDRYGGFLAWNLYPADPVFIDGRFTLRGAEFLKEYIALLGNPDSGFSAIEKRYAITHVVCQTAIFPIYNRLAAYLYHSSRWRLVTADGSEALFVLDSLAATPRVDLGSPAIVDSIAGALTGQWSQRPALYREALYHFAHLLDVIGERASADRVMAMVRGRVRPD